MNRSKGPSGKELVDTLSLTFFFGHAAWLAGLSSPTRDQTEATGSGSGVLTTGTPGKSLYFSYIYFILFIL